MNPTPGRAEHAYLAALTSTARTFLFVPGDRPERFAKARAADPGLVVLDLEDAVAPEAKVEARRSVVDALRGGLRAGVRINATGTLWQDDDLAALEGFGCVAIVPKAEEPAQLEVLGTRWPVVALIETARGVLHAPDLAAVPGVVRLAFGSFDLAAELGVSPDDRDAMAAARGTLVLASSAAGIAPPIDGVTGNVVDIDVLANDVRYARRLGFGAKLCIHPNQVATADAYLLPSTDDLIWAQGIIEAVDKAGNGVVVANGSMIDKPVIDRARRVLRTGDSHG